MALPMVERWAEYWAVRWAARSAGGSAECWVDLTVGRKDETMAAHSAAHLADWTVASTYKDNKIVEKI